MQATTYFRYWFCSRFSSLQKRHSMNIKGWCPHDLLTSVLLDTALHRKRMQICCCSSSPSKDNTNKGMSKVQGNVIYLISQGRTGRTFIQKPIFWTFPKVQQNWFTKMHSRMIQFQNQKRSEQHQLTGMLQFLQLNSWLLSNLFGRLTTHKAFSITIFIRFILGLSDSTQKLTDKFTSGTWHGS